MTPHQAFDPYPWGSVLSLIHRAFAGMEGRIDPPSSMHALTAAAIAEQATAGEVWVIGTPCIACLFLTAKAESLYLHKLAVDPASQRQGHARALVATAAARARALALPALTLSARVELVENHQVFRNLGFVETHRSTHPGHVRPTTIHFACALGAAP